ncbi:MAG: glutamine amidotransferase [Myxococcales bacterium]|jgi:GMP synthase (glutamine-hydrolysing)
MRPLAILIAGEPIPAALAARGSFGRMIREAAGDAWLGPWLEVDARAELPDFERFSGLIISGSPANVPTREPWIVEVEHYLARAVPAGLPTFGICFGHQLLGQALGGLVSKNPRGLEVGTVSLQVLAEDPLLADSPAEFAVNMTHVDSVVTLPPGARVLARTAQDEHALVYFGQRAWGVQFHPEMDAEITGYYWAARSGPPQADALDGPRGPHRTRDTPESRALLRRFVEQEVAPRA